MAARDSADAPTPVPGGAGASGSPAPGSPANGPIGGPIGKRPMVPGKGPGAGLGSGGPRILGSFLDPSKLNPAGLVARGADAETVAPEDLADSISATISARLDADADDGLTDDGLLDDGLLDDGLLDDGDSFDVEGGSVLDDFDDDLPEDVSLGDEDATFLSDPPPELDGSTPPPQTPPAKPPRGQRPPVPETPSGTLIGGTPDTPSGTLIGEQPDSPSRTLIGGDTTAGTAGGGTAGGNADGPVGNFADDDSLAGASSQNGASSLTQAGDAADVPTGQMAGAAGDAADVPTGEMGPVGATMAGGDTADGTGPGGSSSGGPDGSGPGGSGPGGTSKGGSSKGGGTAEGGSGRTAGGTGLSVAGDSAGGSAGGSAGASAGASLTGGAAHVSETVPTRQIARDPASADPRSDYAVLAALGEGGMGVVSRAEQRSLGRDVALKQVKGRVSARQKARLATEAVVTGELEHPNIVPVYDLGRDAGGDLFYAMKVIGGRGWHKTLKLAPGEEGALSEEEHLDVWLKVADAVAFAHHRGVINYDLKPENVQLDGFGQVLVLDWGLAHVTDRFASPGRVADNQRGGGSPAYMAPEQGHNQLASMRLIDEPDIPVTAAVDVYLLGAMLWEIATGQRPHTGDDRVAAQIAKRAGRSEPVRLDKTLACCVAARENVLTPTDRDDELIAVARKAMATDPADRYESVEALQDAVRDYRAHGQSRRLTARGSELVAAGELARGAAAFDDAVALWPANAEAKTLATDTQHKLDRRKRATRTLAISLALVTLIGLTTVSYLYADAVEQTRVANVERAKAEEAHRDLIAAQDVIVQEKNAAIAAHKQALAAEALARTEQIRAEKAAEEARKSAEAERLAAIAEREAKVAAEEATKKALAAAEAEKKATMAAEKARLDEAKAKEQAIAAADAARKSAMAEKEAKELALMEQKKAVAAAAAEKEAKELAVAQEKKAIAAAMAAEKSAAAEKAAKLVAVAEQKRAEEAAEAARLAAEAERQAKLAAIAARRVSEHRSFVSLVRAADDRRRDDLGGARDALETLDRTAPAAAPAAAEGAVPVATGGSPAPAEPEGFEVRYLRAELARSRDAVAAAAGAAGEDDAVGPAPDLTGVAALPTSGRASRFAIAGADGVIRVEPAEPGGAPILLRDPQLIRLRGLALGETPDGPLLAAVGDGRRGEPLSVALWALGDIAEQNAEEQQAPLEPTRRLGALRPGSALAGVRVGRGPDGPLVLAWGEEAAGGEGLERNRPHGALFAWNPTAGAPEPALRIGLSGDERPLDADLSADGARLAAVVGSGAGVVRLWNLTNDSENGGAVAAENAGAFRGHTTFRSGSTAGALTDGATCVRFAPDGPWGAGRVVSGGAEGRVLLWNAADVRRETGLPPRDLRGRPGAPPRSPREIETLAVWAHHDGDRGLPVRALDVLKAPDPTAAEGGVALLVASAGDDARVRLWRTDGSVVGDGSNGNGGGNAASRAAASRAAAGVAGLFTPLVWDESNATDPAGRLARQSPATLDFALPPSAVALTAIPGGYALLAVGPGGEADRLTDVTLAPVAVAADDSAGGAGSGAGAGARGALLDLKQPITALRTAPGRPGAVAAASAGGAIRVVTGAGRVGRYEEGTLQSSRDTYAALSAAGLGRGGVGAGSGRRLAATTSAGAVLLWDVPRRGLVRRFAPARELVTASRRAPLPAVAAAVAEVDADLAAQMTDELGESIQAGSVVLAYAAGDRTVAVLHWPQDGPPAPIRRIRLDAAPTALGFTGDVSALVIGSEDGRLWAADPFLLEDAQDVPPQERPRNPTGPARLLGDTGERQVPPLVVKPLPGAAALVGNKRLFQIDLTGLDLAALPTGEAAGDEKGGAKNAEPAPLAIGLRYGVENPIVTQTAVWPAGAFGAAAGFAVVEQTGKDTRDLVIFRADQPNPLARLPLGSRAFAVAAAPNALRPRLAVTVGTGTDAVVRVLEVDANGTPRSLASLPAQVAGGAVSAAAFSADGGVLLLSTPAGVAIWDPTKDAPEDGRLGGGAGETTLAFDPAGDFLLAGDASGAFQLLAAEPDRSGGEGASGDLPALLKRSVPAVGTDADGNPQDAHAVARPAITAVAIGGTAADPPEAVRTLLVAAGRRAWLYEYDPTADALVPAAGEAPADGAAGQQAGAALTAPRGLGGELAAHAAPITAAAFVPGPEGQRWALTADADGAVRLWDVNAPDRALAEAVAEIGGAGVGVNDLAVPAVGLLTTLSDDGAALENPAPTDRRLVVAAATDAGPFVWVFAPPGAEGDNAEGGKNGTWTSLRVALRGRGGAARGVAFAPDRPDRLISAGADGAAQIWDWNGSAVGWDPIPGPEIADAGWEVSESLLALDRPSSGNVASRNGGDGHEGGLTAVAIAPDGSAVLTGGEDGRVLKWTAPPAPGARVATGR
ncbi:protein kinase domain-containing protein [Alienimonas californiensis]|uniref:Serine/threonine-protein kinase PknD n=1 Tax=Alienimonas californiensis TaxID=2527989 RepID=A0A517P6U5_9PLAN|nr:protein kinase [Alienimonas californiensis]QDT15094.1 Serine/threonine-protein kinase PknD [Alienimonas californiensis]